MKGRALIYLAIAAALFVAYFEKRPALYAKGTIYQVYDVTIQGTADNQAFSRGGALFILPPGSDDDPETATGAHLWLVSGKPSGTAGAGAIWLATHDGFYGGQEKNVFAQVTTAANRLAAEFEEEWPTINANAFSISTDPSQNAVRLVAGRMNLELLSNGRIEGQLELLGRRTDSLNLLSYTATVSGSYFGERAW